MIELSDDVVILDDEDFDEPMVTITVHQCAGCLRAVQAAGDVCRTCAEFAARKAESEAMKARFEAAQVAAAAGDYW